MLHENDVASAHRAQWPILYAPREPGARSPLAPGTGGEPVKRNLVSRPPLFTVPPPWISDPDGMPTPVAFLLVPAVFVLWCGGYLLIAGAKHVLQWVCGGQT